MRGNRFAAWLRNEIRFVRPVAHLRTRRFHPSQASPLPQKAEMLPTPTSRRPERSCTLSHSGHAKVSVNPRAAQFLNRIHTLGFSSVIVVR